MNLKFWEKKEPQNVITSETFDRSFSSTPTMSGAYVTDGSALKQSAVFSCVRVLGETVASLPVRVYQRTDNGRVEVDHPLNRLLTVSCNGEQTGFELREYMMTCLGLRGNAFAQKIYNNRGQLAQINPLNAAHMKVCRRSDDSLEFLYTEKGNERTFTTDQIWRIAGMGSDGVTGLSPIALFRESIGASIAMEGHTSSSFKNGVQPSIVLSHPNTLKEESFLRLKEQLEQQQAGFGNANKPMIVEGGMSANVIGMTHADAQFIEGRKFQAEDIARVYRVPPHMIGLMDRATFSNIEQQSMDFVTNVITPWLVRIESTMSRDLLSSSEIERGLFISHKVQGLLRGDTKSRNEAYSVGIDKGWLSRNEVRKMENLNPVDGLDEYVLPVNIETLSEREQRFSNALVQMLSDQEINALRSESKRGGDDLSERVVNYYARFAERLEGLGISKEKSNEYVINHITLFDEGKQEQLERTAQRDLERLLNE